MLTPFRCFYTLILAAAMVVGLPMLLCAQPCVSNNCLVRILRKGNNPYNPNADYRLDKEDLKHLSLKIQINDMPDDADNPVLELGGKKKPGNLSDFGRLGVVAPDGNLTRGATAFGIKEDMESKEIEGAISGTIIFYKGKEDKHIVICKAQFSIPYKIEKEKEEAINPLPPSPAAKVGTSTQTTVINQPISATKTSSRKAAGINCEALFLKAKNINTYSEWYALDNNLNFKKECPGLHQQTAKKHQDLLAADNAAKSTFDIAIAAAATDDAKKQMANAYTTKYPRALYPSTNKAIQAVLRNVITTTTFSDIEDSTKTNIVTLVLSNSLQKDPNAVQTIVKKDGKVIDIKRIIKQSGTTFKYIYSFEEDGVYVLSVADGKGHNAAHSFSVSVPFSASIVAGYLKIIGGTPPFLVWVENEDGGSQLPSSPIRSIDIADIKLAHSLNTIKVEDKNGELFEVQHTVNLSLWCYKWWFFGLAFFALIGGIALWQREKLKVWAANNAMLRGIFALKKQPITIKKQIDAEREGNTLHAGDATAVIAPPVISIRQIENVVPESPAPIAQMLAPEREYYSCDLTTQWKDTQVAHVYIHKKFKGDLNRLIIWETERYQASGSEVPEIGGFALGYMVQNAKTKTYKLYLHEFIKVTAEHNGVYEIKFGNEAFQQLDDARQEYPNMELLAWFHTHPGHGLFLSQPDLEVHQHFNKPFQLAMEIDTLSENLDLAFFSYQQNGMVNNVPKDLKKGSQWFSWVKIDKWSRTI
jgi:proteasome lid subunit RPN8/RPN11